MKYTYINLIITTKPKKFKEQAINWNQQETRTTNLKKTKFIPKISTTQHFKLMKYTYINLIITTKPKKFKEQAINWNQQETRTTNFTENERQNKIKTTCCRGFKGGWRVAWRQHRLKSSSSSDVQAAAVAYLRCAAVCGIRACEESGLWGREWALDNVEGKLKFRRRKGNLWGIGSVLRGKIKKKIISIWSFATTLLYPYF